MKKLFTILFLLSALPGWAQNQLQGVVLERGTQTPVVGAYVLWPDGKTNAFTDAEGAFTIAIPEPVPRFLIVSHVAYGQDTIPYKGQQKLTVSLQPIVSLGEAKVVEKRETLQKFLYKDQNLEVMTEGELQKAACCNLSESFSTNATVDVAFSDAVSGAKQIRMLGLDGVYTSMMVENMPSLRGLASAYGLQYVPGPWMEAVAITKGTGSVVNGFEGVTGMINLEYKKPDEMPDLFVNLFTSAQGRLEANVLSGRKLNDKWSVGLLTHASGTVREIDQNEDNFLDQPLQRQFNAMARWKYKGKRLRHQFYLSGLHEYRQGGDIRMEAWDPDFTTNLWGMSIDVTRFDAGAKFGYLFPEQPYRSLALITNASWHDQETFFGRQEYAATQGSLISRLVYQSIIGNTQHTFRTGLSFVGDTYHERFNALGWVNTELIPGAFFEYTYQPMETFTLLPGIRTDYHSDYGLFVLPRLHVRWNPAPGMVLRGGGGRSFRSPHAIAENLPRLYSGRELVLAEDPQAEVAWNYGVNWTQTFRIKDMESSFSLDLFRTDFTNQYILDYYSSPTEIGVYNIEQSFANVAQAEFTIEPVERMSVRLAGKWQQVERFYQNELLPVPYIAEYRGLVNVGYNTKYEKWSFDVTGQFVGPQALPAPAGELLADEGVADYSPSFGMVNSQITRRWKRLQLYAGGENLFNYMQPNPVLNTESPFSEEFDASHIWGPVLGRRVYAGLRYTLD